MRTIGFVFVVAVLAVSAGCESPTTDASEQITTLRHEKMELQHRLEETQSRYERAQRQIEVLSGLDADVRLENLYDLQQVKVTKYTNVYDKDKDGTHETLIVYLQPVDAEDDLVKASGTVDVELWDLDKPNGRAMLGRWHVAPAELKEMWFATIVTTNYRLTFDVSAIIDTYKRPLTVRVTFTDYLSGRVFKEQRVIKPRR